MRGDDLNIGTAAAPAVSVVIPTRDRPALLRRCLEALAAQEAEGAAFEVVVVDDGVEVGTQQVVDDFRARLRMRLLHTSGRGPAAARNRGWRSARASVIAFTDDDTVPGVRWLAEGLRVLAPGVAAVSGRVIVPTSQPPTDYERDVAGLSAAEFVTANCFVRCEALERVSGFDECFTMAWREDSDLQFRLLREHERIVRASEPTVIHPVRPARWGESLRQQRKVMFDALLYRKHPKLYRLRIRARPRWDYYLIVTLLIGGAVLLVAGHPPIGAALLVVWLLLVLLMTGRRLADTSHAPAHVVEMLVTSMAIPPLAVWWRLVGSFRFRVLFT